MDPLQISIIQANLIWEDPVANRQQFGESLKALQGITDLVVLPEMFTTGFSMNASGLAETMDGPSITWMQEQASNLNAVLCGSLIIEEEGHFYNRFIWMEPDGSFQHYDKRHLFTYAKEDHHYTAGMAPLLIEYKGWKIFPLICYDLRFPVWSRNAFDYDLLIYVANFPAKRRYAWKQLLIARAIENQVYTIGVNRVGNDGNDIAYSGDSTILNYAGAPIVQLSEQPGLFTTTLDYSAQKAFRDRFRFLPDADAFAIH